MAGGRLEWLSPSILVWCDGRDTKIRVKKFFDEDYWLKERMRSHGISHYVLDKAPRRCAKPIHHHRKALHTTKGSSLNFPGNISTPCGLDLVFGNGRKSKIGGLITVDGVPYLTAAKHGLHETSTISSTSSVKDKALIGRCGNICSETSSSLSSGDIDSASDRCPHSRATTPTSVMSLTGAKMEDWPVTVMYPLVLADEDVLLGYPTNDLDWLLVDLSDAPVALLDKVLKPNLFQRKHIQGLHVGEIDGHSLVTVVTTDQQPQPGFLSSLYSTLQVEGSLYEVMLITLEKPLRKY
jgi:hypothetical protein